jgi:ADP-heptose:LPS heptosyltransferase
LKRPLPENFKRILVINLGGIGDTILSSPALKALRARYPDSCIDFLSVDRVSDLVASYGLFNTMYRFPSNDISRAAMTLLQLRRNKYDLVMNMRTMVGWSGCLKMFFLVKCINGKYTAGRDTDKMGFFFDIKIPETYRGDKPEYEFDFALVKALGADVSDTSITVPLTLRDTEHASALLAKNNILPDAFIIGINPGGQLSRRWPKESFIRLIGLLFEASDCAVILTGSSNERELCAAIASAFDGRKVADLSDQTGSITQLAAVIKTCKLYVSNDTGSTHVCVSTGVPGVFLYGGGNTVRFAPRDSSRYKIIQKNVPCSPCEKYFCDTMTCMKTISVEEVYAAIIELKGTLYD